jgi:hypothetical protein
MFEIALVLGFGILALRGANKIDEDELSVLPRKIADKVGKLWDIAHQGMRENRFLTSRKSITYYPKN